MQNIINKLGQFLRKFFSGLYKHTILALIHFFKNIGLGISKMIKGWRAHPVAFRRGLRSFFIPGWGQYKNKQWYKAVPFFVFFLVVITLELSTSRYLKAFTEINQYPIVTQEMIEGGTFYQLYRTPETIVGGHLITATDLEEDGDYQGMYRQAGDYAIVNYAYLLLDADDVSSSGDFYQSPYLVGDVTKKGDTSPYMLKTTDINSSGTYYQSYFEVGDIGIYNLTSQDVAANGAFYQKYRKAGDRIAYVVTAQDLLPKGTYFEVNREVNNLIKHVITAEDLETGGLYENSGKAVNDIDYVLLTTENIADYQGYLVFGDVLNGTMLSAPDSTFRIAGDVVWDTSINGYRQLSSANVSDGASYYQSPRQAGDIISADGINRPILITQAMVADQGLYYGSGYSQGMTVPYTLTTVDVSDGGNYYQSLYARNDSFYVPIDEFDIQPNMIDVKINEGVYRRVLGVQSDNVSDKIFFFRDYGGWFTKGLWGLFTLGQVPMRVDDQASWYRGWPVIVFRSSSQMDYPAWVEADNSTSLLTNGVIVLVVTLILLVLYIGNISDAYHSQRMIEETNEIEEPKKWVRRIWDSYFSYIIVLPTFILIAFFTLIPFAFSFLTAFTSWTSRVSVPDALIEWRGIANFANIFEGGGVNFRYFGNVFVWTLIFAITASLTCYIVGMIQALVIQSKYVVAKKLWRTIFILPWAIPSLVTLLMFRNIFSAYGGLANQVIDSFGGTDLLIQIKAFLYSLGLYGQEQAGAFSGQYIQWFGLVNYKLGRLLIIVINLWIGYPYFMLLITGSLTSIPSDMYEAADIDGASSLQKTRFITIPWILRATTPVIITTLTHNFNNFGVIYFLTGSVPATYTWTATGGYTNIGVPNSAPSIYDILISWVYRLAMLTTVREYNVAAVYSIIIFMMVGIFSVYNLSRVKSFWEED